MIKALGLALLLAATAHSKPLVLLDPGHGGTDRGVQVDGFDESAFSLELAQKTLAALRKAGIDARLTRNADGAMSLASRTALANGAYASALVSLHANYSYNQTAQGLRVFVPPAGPVDEPQAPLWEHASRLRSGESKKLGLQIATALGHREGKSVQSLKLALFRGLKVPAAQVELDFASNEAGLAALKDPAQIEAAAAKLAQGIAAFVRNPGEVEHAPAQP